MAGNTRGKLKEHLEGIHRNLDWCIHHINTSLQLIDSQLQFTPEYIAVKDNPEEIQKVLEANNVYKAFKGLGEIIQLSDETAQSIYTNI